MKRFILPAVAMLLLSGCAGHDNDTAPGGPSPDAPLFSESEAIGLVNLWRVTDAAGESAETWLRLDAHEFQLWRDCGMIMGSWAAGDTLFLASVHGASGDCATDAHPQVEWLESATRYERTADGYQLLSDTGVVASLAIDGAPEHTGEVAEFLTEPPELTEEVHAHFAAPAPLADGLTPPTPDALHGRWSPSEPAPNEPHVAFSADGTWTGSDGCNGGGGRWAVGASGEFLATSGPSTLMFCEGAQVPSWVAQATTAGMDSGGLLRLFDASGTELGVLAADR